MQATVLFTFPFVFPKFPEMRFLLSRLQKGPVGRFALAIEPAIDYETPETACAFYEIDLRQQTVFHSQMQFARFYTFVEMDICYDQVRETWIVALKAAVFQTPLNLYEISRDMDNAWRLLFAANDLDRDVHVGKGLVAFWRQGEYSPLVFRVFDVPQMYDYDVYWTHWQASDREQPLYQYMSSSYRRACYREEGHFLLFSLQCHYDQMQSDPIYRKKGPGQWHFHVAAYEPDGSLIHEKQIEDIALPVLHLLEASRDLHQWLLPYMCIGPGPMERQHGKKTCVAALVMRDDPEMICMVLKQAWKQRETRPPQGGLYWIDLDGKILQVDRSLTGARTSLCLCGEQVVGATLQDGSWHLWNWWPASAESHTVKAHLSSQLRRVTVVANEVDEETKAAWFWCVEEHEEGLRVTRRTCDLFEEMEALWCEEYVLPDWWEGSPLLDEKPHGVVAYEDTLLVLAMNREKQLQLLQFQ